MRSLHLPFGAAIAALVLTACGGNTVAAPPTETTAVLCQDDEDNDLDGFTDCDDPDCQGFVFCAQAVPSEVTAATCADGADNDADGQTDCDDSDCRGFVFCTSAESSSTACDNGTDDDSDGLTDCDDPDCAGLVFCQPPTEDTAALCQDGTDNDSDGLTDCDDPDCELLVACAAGTETTAAACRDNIDNDGDGRLDCLDPDCAGYTFCLADVENTTTACQDGADNDRDGLIDCSDPDCQGFTFCYSPDETTAIACQDGQENDGDGLTDCDDPDCAGFVFCRTDLEVSSTSCQDGLDNDSDGTTDCEDPDCAGYVFCLSEESTTVACQDGTDNDSDGLTDCSDPDCAGFVFCVSEESSATDCQDGADNDSDGLTDCGDPDCAGFVFCVSEESTSAACQDDVDNDSDGLTDCDDVDCQGFVFCVSVTEGTSTACQDGADNDSDGLTDCDDPECQGYTFCAAPQETTLAECQDGADNDSDGLVDCDDTDCQGYLQCQQGSITESTLAECQDGLDNDDDGLTDCDDDACWVWGVCGHYHGYPLYDTWGEVWDGVERAAKTQAEAEATCQALGGRLPTATELWRNNWASGTGDVGDHTQTSYLWTRIERQAAGQFAIVRLSDGSVTYSAAATPRAFRCVWPDGTGTGFDGYRCHGPAGEPCFQHDRFWSVDKYDRAPLDFAAAANECEFYGASLPPTAEWGELIHGGLPNGTNAWMWSAKSTYWYNGNYGVGIVRWTDANASSWYYDNGAMGALSLTADARQFRCVGLTRPADFAAPNPSACNGDCATFTDRRSTVVADTQDRVAIRMAAAVATCRAEGALLPNLPDAIDLMHGGWADGTAAWNWLTDAMYWYNLGFGHGIVRWSGVGPASAAYYPNFGSLSIASNNRAYRCLWHQLKPALPSCQAGEIIEWDGASFVCAAGGLGDSDGNANPNGQQLRDEWGNAWDTFQRNTAVPWADAKQTCESLGGRLPTATELWAVRASGNPHASIGDVTSTSLLWTSSPGGGNTRAAVRVSDGAATRYAPTTSQFFRCVWPAPESEVLYGANCYGPPGSECFVTSDGLRADTYDRVAVDMATAIEECRASGGHLPDHRDMIRMIHSGAPNGTNAWLWMAESIYWYSGAYGYTIARWPGTGTPSWEWAYSATAERSGASSNRNFRCVYTPELR